MATTHVATGQDITVAESRTSALSLMALGRVILAGVSLAAPRGFAKILGVTPSPELTYMTRIYGARAFAMGLGYLTSGTTERHRWRRLALVVDTTDTVSGFTHLVRRDLPLRAALSMVALTGSYAAIGATKLATEQLGKSSWASFAGGVSVHSCTAITACRCANTHPRAGE